MLTTATRTTFTTQPQIFIVREDEKEVAKTEEFSLHQQLVRSYLRLIDQGEIDAAQDLYKILLNFDAFEQLYNNKLQKIDARLAISF